MKKIITILMCSFLGNTLFSQWKPVDYQGVSKKSVGKEFYYKLDLNAMRDLLKNAEETGKNSKAVEIFLPTLGGKLEKFAVYSFPVMVKELADQYQLGSYVGVGIDDSSKYVRFSLAPNDFQSMMFKNGETEFIGVEDKNNNIYAVHLKSKDNKEFICGTDESPIAIKELQELKDQGKSFHHQPADFSKSSDQKFRTMRLAISTAGEYTQFFGGTVAGALAGINATMTIINGIFERDFALHLEVQNYPGLIYTDPATDPYSNESDDWNLELQNVLTTNVGNAGYDIGHLLGGPPSGTTAGNAGCLGCICVDPTIAIPRGKGSGFTGSLSPTGESYAGLVIHEMGHQLGATHTFSHNLEGSGTNVEPGSGSTIMSYAGQNPAIQLDRDLYYQFENMRQVQINLIDKTCDIETPITNSPPVIAPLPVFYTIPKGTAFVLTADVTDPEGDPMTYTWEEIDNASSPVLDVTGNNTTGALFRSLLPGTSPTRYFPKLSSVLEGNLTNPSDWETVSNVERLMGFALTVRDNHPVANEKQTQTTTLFISVKNDGPFKINTTQVNPDTPSLVEWDVVNTNTAPYGVVNVKIDYTTDNGSTWNVLSASTPNDGSENLSFPMSLNNKTIKLRVSAIDNVFYAIQKIVVTNGVCETITPMNIVTNNITLSSAVISWDPIANATYQIRYKKSMDASWVQTTSSTNTIPLNNLDEGTPYDVQVATVCSGTAGTFSNTINFTTSSRYCSVSFTGTPNDYISNVSLSNLNHSSGANGYTNYAHDPLLEVDLVKGSTYTLSVTKNWLDMNPRPDAVAAFIDYDNNGDFFGPSETIMSIPNIGTTNPITETFTVPSDAVLNQQLRLRVILIYSSTPGGIIFIPCADYETGEVEDYSVRISDVLSTNDVVGSKDEVQLYPNPVSDVLRITKVSDKAAYKIYSSIGQLIMKGNVMSNQINVSELIKGEYVITIEEKGKDIFKSKFIKK
ncbi:T9SS C-terminal target domain-containing protein [Chryseobacterium nematophagum]|uniref:T9SS C-terminal target domain-containing protein n=1 Tax=Chryseobacterium nematophagum TaxID=2305228 RepID=A0A3M7TKX8_9FLAO|nr:zinc-dependent metalloprotease family protein [Chryseobacterium nematophagum]RNA63567.1 T9SS C-terminal target domain-containing protein [Chryseobacterium nematophagum]